MSLRHFTFMDLFKRNALLYPQAAALVSEQQSMSYSQLFQESCALQAGLLQNNLQAGERIAVLAKNSFHFFPLFGAASNTGSILVLINRRLSPEEIQDILQDTSPRLIISDEESVHLAQKLMHDCLSLRSHFVINGQGAQSYAHLLHYQSGDSSQFTSSSYQNGSHDPFAIIHTAAVQGKPRGAVLSQDNLLQASLQLAYALKLQTSDCYLNILPLFHIMGINLALSTLIAGGRNVIMPQFDPLAAAQLIREQQVSLLGTFPPILAKLLEAIQDSSVKPSSLRHVLGLEQAETIETFQETSGARFWSMYGQTETSGLISYAPYAQRPGAAGQAGSLVDLKIVDEFDRDVPRNETGEILVRGPLVFQGYWQQPELTDLTFRENWHHTGDLGMLDDAGFLFFTGRKTEKDLIKSGGENVFPVEVEKVILEHPAVLEVSVIGIPDATFGEGIKAVCCIHPEQSLSDQDLIRFVAERIASYKKPRSVQFVDSLPKTEQGSNDRSKVKELYG